MDQDKKNIALLEDLLRHEGWKLYESNIQANVELVRECIIKKQDAEGNPLTDEQVDGLRERLGYLEELKETPQNMIAILKAQSEETIEENDPDPYLKSIKP